MDENNNELERGQTGEICVKGKNVMKGYFKNEEATKKVLKDGWLHTGDLAQLQENGYGHIVVRKKNVIIKSGFSVYPRELEMFFSGHPKISEAAVVGLPNPEQGEEIHACIVLKEGEAATEEEIIDYIKGRMAAYKCPNSVHFMDSLPKGSTGRVLREYLKQQITDNV